MVIHKDNKLIYSMFSYKVKIKHNKYMDFVIRFGGEAISPGFSKSSWQLISLASRLFLGVFSQSEFKYVEFDPFRKYVTAKNKKKTPEGV